MQKTDIWMPLYIGDYLADTSRLTTEQHGAYLLLLMDYWRSGRLPDNDQVLAQITKLSPDAWSNARAMLEQFFSIENGSWIHKRVEQELAQAVDNKAKNHQRAVDAANARWKKQQNDATSNANSNAQAMLKQCPSPSPSPSKIIIKDIAPEGVSESIFKDYLEVRKAKKAKWTQTALKGLQREADKAKMSLQDVMQLCCERNWVGFKAEWANSQDPVSKKGDDKSWMFSNEGIEAKARELGVSDYGVANHFQLKDKILQVMAKKAMA
jgi:uncharacterized protein YdaU (DUF1376 family)